jgi:sugar fermentation stimulation protein A
MKFPPLQPGVLLQRKNRFSALVQLEGGEKIAAYVPTTGRLTGALQPGYRVWLENSHNPKRKLAYTVLLSELLGGGLCSINAMMANALFIEAVQKKRLHAFPYEQIEKEVVYGHSRLDFRLSSSKGVCWVEVKSVTYVENGIGMFPDAPTDRGKRHLEVLAELAKGGQRAAAVFIAQRADALYFAPYEAVDPEFSKTLRQVHQQGVEIVAYRCKLSLEEISISNAIPVVI